MYNFKEMTKVEQDMIMIVDKYMNNRHSDNRVDNTTHYFEKAGKFTTYNKDYNGKAIRSISVKIEKAQKMDRYTFELDKTGLGRGYYALDFFTLEDKIIAADFIFVTGSFNFDEKIELNKHFFVIGGEYSLDSSLQGEFVMPDIDIQKNIDSFIVEINNKIDFWKKNR